LDEVVGTPIAPDSRDAFAMWLSGFVDGEGCFQINRRRHSLAPCGFVWVILFSLGLRADDIGILYEIQRFWGVGSIEICQREFVGFNAKPSAIYRVFSLKAHREVLVPHFLRYPLRAKKARDFGVWCEAVRFASAVSARPALMKPGGRRSGMAAKWQNADHDYMQHLMMTLREGRKYDGDLGRLPGPPPVLRFEETTVPEDLQGDDASASAGDLVAAASR
jgi:hypothetical protein